MGDAQGLGGSALPQCPAGNWAGLPESGHIALVGPRQRRLRRGLGLEEGGAEAAGISGGEEQGVWLQLLGNERAGVLGTGTDAEDVPRELRQPGAWGQGGEEGKEMHCRELACIPQETELQAGDGDKQRGRGGGRQRAVVGCWAGLGCTAGQGW